MEVVKNEPFENEELGKGQYTHKIYHLARYYTPLDVFFYTRMCSCLVVTYGMTTLSSFLPCGQVGGVVMLTKWSGLTCICSSFHVLLTTYTHVLYAHVCVCVPCMCDVVE